MSEQQTTAALEGQTPAGEAEAGAASTAAEHQHGGAGGAPVEAMPLNQLFEPDELKQFDAEDVQAGANIGKMLALFFFYTVVVMSVVAWWTYTSVVE